ncbi:MAG TPA: YbfB/YjiJ family MFS transporter, partial [bacterium]|nr:YbfB/YjiJ family MFS transporter [bacterium]
EAHPRTRVGGRQKAPALGASNLSEGAGAFPWRAALAGFSAVLVANGLGRFAYSSLIPPLVEDHWFTAAQADYLGSANLAGYLLGSVGASRLSLVFPMPPLLRASMAVAAAGFLCCVRPGPFGWFALWRFLTGVAGGILMILPPPALLARVPEEARHRMRAVIFSGLGIGVILSATAIPALLKGGLAWAWAGLGLLCLALMAASWNDWPTAPPAENGKKVGGARFSRPLGVLMGIYCTGAAGLLPCTLFWVDFIARGLHLGLGPASFNWVLFGVGCFLGPWLAALLGRRAGFAAGIRWCLGGMGGADLLAAFFHQPLALWIISLTVGACSMSNVSLVLGRAGELAGLAGQKQAWGWLTASFSLALAVAAYGLSYLFARTDSYGLVFAVGGALPLLGVLADLMDLRLQVPSRTQGF